MNINLKFLDGFGGLLKYIGIKLIQFFPIYALIFIAYGDKFLPPPLSDFSVNTRNTVNGILVGSFDKDMLQNNQYNNKKSDKVLKELEMQK